MFRRNMNRHLLRSFLLLPMVILIFGISGAQDAGVFTIGILGEEHTPLSNGARLAVQQLNNAGGVIGANGASFRLELLHVPLASGENLPNAVSTIQDAGVIAVIGPETTEDALRGLAVLQSLNVPVLTTATGDTIIASDSSGRIFRVRAPDAVMGRALADYIINDIGARRIVTVQLDISSTANVVGFSAAASTLGAPPQASYLLDNTTNIAEIATTISQINPQVVVVFGPPTEAGQLYGSLRSNNWGGQFAYNDTQTDEFRANVPFSELSGILGVTTWSLGSTDPASNEFLNTYIRTFGALPSPVAAASYDAVYLIAEAIRLPGELTSNLSQINNVQGAQGLLRPAQLIRGEMSDNVMVTQLGAFGAPEVRARFLGSQRITDEEVTVVVATPTPQPTATPDGVVLTIQSSVQNVRSGPGLEYDVLGQMQQGEQARVIGATADFSWVVISYRGQNGWLATYLLEVFGERSTVPIVQIPPTPTALPATLTPTAPPFPDIVIVNASPSRITRGVPFNAMVTVRNQGTVDAGPFAVAATFLPDNLYNGVNVPGLAAGQQTTVTLTGTLNGATGPQAVVIIADLNSQVDEGPGGEANNNGFTYNYVLDRSILNAGTLTFNPGGVLNLEGAGTADVMWNAGGTALDFVAPVPAGSGMFILTGLNSIEQVHYNMIDPALVSATSLNVALLPNAYIGIITAEGNRGVIHVDSVVAGGLITLTYRVYAP